jgi:hypothetical protein
MDFINPETVKRAKDARKHLMTMQQRIHALENMLDDLTRSVEIAQFSRQYQLTETYVTEAAELLKDRLVLPEIDQSDFQYTMVETTQENLEKGMEILKEDPTIAERKHGHIDSIHVRDEEDGA